MAESKMINVKFRPETKKDSKNSQQQLSARIYVNEANLIGLGAVAGDDKPCLIEGPGTKREAILGVDKLLSGSPGKESRAKASQAFLDACGFKLTDVYRITALPGPIPDADEVVMVDITEPGRPLTVTRWKVLLEMLLEMRLAGM